MDRPLLKRPAAGLPGGLAAVLRAGLVSALMLAGATGVTGCGRLFEDTLEELDPALRDASLSALPASANFSVPRGHLLESFGAFGCVSCPGAEARLRPYLHPDPSDSGSPLYIVNYHVKFGTIRDPWIIPASQAVNDRRGYTSLPQAVMDGSNAPFGIREKDVDFSKGEYDTLVARARRQNDPVFLELRLDTASWTYDSATGRADFRFLVLNRDDNRTGPLSFRVLFAKNRSVSIPIYAHPWEVIVTGVAETDSAGARMTTAGLAGLTAKSYAVAIKLPSEAANHVVPAPGGPENPAGYALLLVAEDETGVIRNVSGYRYDPVLP